MSRSLFMLLLVGQCASVALCSSDGVHTDPAGDAAVRRTDVGNDAVLQTGFEPIDLLKVSVQGWVPTAPASSAYIGQVTTGEADFVRIVVVFDGLVSPPGPLGLGAGGSAYDPQRYGQRPVYGYIGIDIDDEKDSGGELMPLARNRYLANVGRFGLVPTGSISERIVRRANDLDSNIFSSPEFERTGSEFTLIMCGCFDPTIVSQDGNIDSKFDPGETWVVEGRFFERFESFQGLSGLFGGLQFGLFDPVVQLVFEHDQLLDQTMIEFVYPITNKGAGLLAGEPEQALDFSLLNHTSIEEAVDDLIGGAPFATGELQTLVENWSDEEFDEFRLPSEWGVHAIIGTAPIVADPSALFVWTDTGFDELFGDLNFDEMVNELDSQVIVDAVDDMDGTIEDADGVVNGEVGISNFGFAFDVNDLNSDGVISEADIQSPICIADFTGDGHLNFFDVSAFLGAFNLGDPIADFTNDGHFNFFDVSAFLTAFNAGCSK